MDLLSNTADSVRFDADAVIAVLRPLFGGGVVRYGWTLDDLQLRKDCVAFTYVHGSRSGRGHATFEIIQVRARPLDQRSLEAIVDGRQLRCRVHLPGGALRELELWFQYLLRAATARAYYGAEPGSTSRPRVAQADSTWWRFVILHSGIDPLAPARLARIEDSQLVVRHERSETAEDEQSHPPAATPAEPLATGQSGTAASSAQPAPPTPHEPAPAPRMPAPAGHQPQANAIPIVPEELLERATWPEAAPDALTETCNRAHLLAGRVERAAIGAASPEWSALLLDLGKRLQQVSEMRNRPLRLGIIGGFSSGKSTLINRLLGEDVNILFTDPAPATARITHLKYSQSGRAHFEVLAANGTCIHRGDLHDGQGKSSLAGFSSHFSSAVGARAADRVVVWYPSDILRDVELIDTPGFDHQEVDNATTDELIRVGHCFAYLFNIKKVLTEQDKDRVDRLRARNAAFVLVATRADGVPPDEVEYLTGFAEEQLEGGDRVIVTSAGANEGPGSGGFSDYINKDLRARRDELLAGEIRSAARAVQGWFQPHCEATKREADAHLAQHEATFADTSQRFQVIRDRLRQDHDRLPRRIKGVFADVAALWLDDNYFTRHKSVLDAEALGQLVGTLRPRLDDHVKNSHQRLVDGIESAFETLRASHYGVPLVPHFKERIDLIQRGLRAVDDGFQRTAIHALESLKAGLELGHIQALNYPLEAEALAAAIDHLVPEESWLEARGDFVDQLVDEIVGVQNLLERSTRSDHRRFRDAVDVLAADLNGLYDDAALQEPS